MALSDYLAELDALAAEATAAFSAAATSDAVEAARVEFLGAKNGRVKAAQKGLGTVAGPEKPAAGKRFHEVKGIVEAALDSAQARLTDSKAASPVDPTFDATLPGRPIRLGKLHPITQTIEELKDIMGRLGFTPHEGPEIEDEWHNFE